MATYSCSLAQLCCGEEHCKQNWLVCGYVWGVLTVDGPHWVCHSPRQCVLSRSTLLSLQGALQGHCSKWALHFMHFPGLSCSGLGSWVLCKGTDSVGHTFLPVPGPRSSDSQVLGEHIVPGGLVILITFPVRATWFPPCATRAPSQVYRVSPLGS